MRVDVSWFGTIPGMGGGIIGTNGNGGTTGNIPPHIGGPQACIVGGTMAGENPVTIGAEDVVLYTWKKKKEF